MKRILTFGASNSTNSINKQLANWVAHQVADAEVNLIDLNDFEMAIYSPERQKAGFPIEATNFKKLLDETDAIVISFAEYNGSYATAFKNIMDWVSRLDRAIWSNKPMFLLATSPGGRGGNRVLDTAVSAFPFMGGKVVASFSLPSFHQNFNVEEGIKEPELKGRFEKELGKFAEELSSSTITV